MSSITIHELDTVLDRRLSEEAKRNQISKNQFIKETLSRALGLPVSGRFVDEYREFCGVWTSVEQDTFNSFQAENVQIDAGDWQS